MPVNCVICRPVVLRLTHRWLAAVGEIGGYGDGDEQFVRGAIVEQGQGDAAVLRPIEGPRAVQQGPGCAAVGRFVDAVVRSADPAEAAEEAPDGRIEGSRRVG